MTSTVGRVRADQEDECAEEISSSHEQNPSATWARAAAVVGAAVWAGLAVLARMGFARIGAIELLFLFAPLVIVPLGMELGRTIGGTGRLGEMARWVQPAGAGTALVSLLLPPGLLAGLLACPWLMVCLLLAGSSVVPIISSLWLEADRSVRSTLRRLSIAVARIDLIVGGSWLVASRLEMRPMGIQEPIGLLTAVHFHFAGFATATIAAATLQFAEKRGNARGLRLLVPLVIGMPFVVAAGFVISPVLKMVAALVFSVSVAGLAVVLHSVAKRVESLSARIYLRAAAVSVFAGMVLSGTYAVADLVGSDVLTIPQMARTHGILNAMGFCLLGMLGWLMSFSAEESGRRAESN
jgi:hypothetical protein